MAITVTPVRHGSARWTRWTTTASVALLALIAGVVSFGHMHELALRAGEGRFTAALIPFSVDGMIVASSMSLLVDSRSGRSGGVLPWTLLVLGSTASLAANVAAATPTVEGRVIAAWPSFALMGAYELLMRQVRNAADTAVAHRTPQRGPAPDLGGDSSARAPEDAAAPSLPPQAPKAGERRKAADRGQTLGCISRSQGRMRPDSRRLSEARSLQQRALAWASAHRAPGGAPPTGKQIAAQFGRSERWGRMIKQAVTVADSPKPAA